MKYCPMSGRGGLLLLVADPSRDRCCEFVHSIQECQHECDLDVQLKMLKLLKYESIYAHLGKTASRD